MFSVDEKPQIQALERTAPVLPMVPGTPERRSHDYERHGTVDLFAALNTATGAVIGKTSAQHAAQDFTAFLDEIDRRVEPDLAVHLICDNLSVHKAPAVKRWLLEHPRFQLHFTPTYSSWLNQVERWFAELQRRRLDRGVFCSIDELTCALEQWIKFWNENAKPFKWTKTEQQMDACAGSLTTCVLNLQLDMPPGSRWTDHCTCTRPPLRKCLGHAHVAAVLNWNNPFGTGPLEARRTAFSVALTIFLRMRVEVRRLVTTKVRAVCGSPRRPRSGGSPHSTGGLRSGTCSRPVLSLPACLLRRPGRRAPTGHLP